MNTLRTTLNLVMLVALTGCGSILATMEVDTIEEDSTQRTMAQQFEDESIEIKARVNMHAGDEAFDDAHLVIVSYNGYLLIAGQVGSEELKIKATDIAREITGVRRIYNELEIASPSSAITRSSDTWITTKVKSRLLADSEIAGRRVKVTTENGVVYLMGLATPDEVERISSSTAKVNGVQRVVRLFEIVS